MKRYIAYFRRSMVLAVILPFVIFTVSFPVYAAWTSGGPVGGDVTCMMRSPSHSAVIYAGTKSGIWKSVDSGDTWFKTRFPDTEVLSIQVAPDNQNIVYAGTTHSNESAGIFKSTDGGISWSLKGIVGQDVNAIAVDPNDTNIIFAGTGSWQADWSEEIIGIFRSTNGGESWEVVISFGGSGEPNMRKITALVVDPDDSSYIYAGGHNYGFPYFAAFLESTDGGEIWTDKALKGPWYYIGGLAITPKGYQPKTLFATVGNDPGPDQINYFYASTDRGATWSVWSATFTRPVIVNPVNSDFVYVGAGSPGVPILIFNHRTESWVAFYSSGLPVTSPTSLVMNPTEESYFCAGFLSAGIYKIRSSGDWYLTPLYATNILDVAVHPGSSNTVVAAIEGDHHLTLSTDGGISWGSLINSPTNRAAVTYDPQNPEYLYAGFGWDDRPSVGLYLNMSTDSGLNWLFLEPMFYSSGILPEGVTDIWVHPNNSQKILVAVGGQYGGIRISSNGGATWSNPRPGSTFWASTVAADPIDPDRLFYGTFHYGYVMLSSNGGISWVDISPGVDTFWEVRDIVVALNEKAYAATDVGLWTWDGLSWAKLNGLPTDDIRTLIIDRSGNPEVLYAGTGDSGVFVSNDGGSSWNVFNEGLGVLHINKLALSDTVPKILYAGTAYGGVWQYDFTAEACEGNFDTDGDVDGSDLAVFAADFGRTDCGSGSTCEGDFDSDNDVDGSDLAVFAADFGRTDCP